MSFANPQLSKVAQQPIVRTALAATVLFAASGLRAQAKQESSTSTELQLGAPVEREVSGDAEHSYSVTLATGQLAEVVVEQRGIDIVLRVFDVQKKLLQQYDLESRLQGREHAVFVAEAAGTYEFRVSPVYRKWPPGRYEIRLVDLRIASDNERAISEAHSLATQSAILDTAGKYDETLAVSEQALAVAEKALSPDDPFMGLLNLNVGMILCTKGENSKAQTFLERAIDISRRSLGPDDPQTARAIQNLGLSYRNREDNAKAEQLFEQSAEITSRTLGPDHPTMMVNLMDLGGQYEERGDFARALPLLQRASAIAEKNLEPDNYYSIAALHNLGDLYLNQDDLDHAEPITEEVLRRVEKKYGPDHPNAAIPLQNLGAIARERGQYDRAIERLTRARTIRQKALGPRHPRTASLLINIGNVYKDQHLYERARECFQEAFDTLESSAGPYHRYTIMALSSLSTIASAEGQPARALEYQSRLNQAVEKNIELNLAIGSERAKLAYIEFLGTRTNRALSLHFRDAPDSKQAAELGAEVLLQRKGRVLDSIADSRTALRHQLGPEGQKLLDDLGSTTTKLAALALNGPGKTPPAEYSKQLASLEEQREKTEAAISRSSAGFYESSSAVTLAAVRAAIPSDALLIEFAIYEPFDTQVRDTGDEPYGTPRYVAYLIPREGEIRWKELADTKSTDEAIDKLRQALRDPSRSDVRSLARAVDAKVMEPLVPLVGDAKHLLLSPDGDLDLIPFEALVDRDGRYLVERYSTTYLSAGRDLLRVQLPRESKNAPIIIANPTFGAPQTQAAIELAKVNPASPLRPSSAAARRSITIGKDLSAVYFAPLAGTAEEARAIQSLFPQSKVLSGKQATQSAILQLEAPSILHIATHGFFLEDHNSGQRGARAPAPSSGGTALENPLLRSGLALSGANLTESGPDNGILTALQAANLNLWGTKLVTLSACDTGVGEVKTGQGVYGLRRAFFLAGTESLVMSLWPVSDTVTREIMTSYYSGLRRGLGRGEALRQAELAMLKRPSRRHPFYWASFIESGAWSPLAGQSNP
jgi:CHAT domain-containing protein/Tfp pilus assembly protein PilF